MPLLAAIKGLENQLFRAISLGEQETGPAPAVEVAVVVVVVIVVVVALVGYQSLGQKDYGKMGSRVPRVIVWPRA